MKINWNGEKTITKDDVEVYKECIICPNAKTCANELKQGDIFCLSLYAKFTDNTKIKTNLENLLKEEDC